MSILNEAALAKEEDAREAVATAWLVAALQRSKRLPGLKRLLGPATTETPEVEVARARAGFYTLLEEAGEEPPPQGYTDRGGLLVPGER